MSRLPHLAIFSFAAAVHLLLFSICPVSGRIYRTNDPVVIEGVTLYFLQFKRYVTTLSILCQLTIIWCSWRCDPAPSQIEISAILRRSRWCMQSIRTLVSLTSSSQIFRSDRMLISTSRPAASRMSMMLRPIPRPRLGSRLLPVVMDHPHHLNVLAQLLAYSVDPLPTRILGRLSWVYENFMQNRATNYELFVGEFLYFPGGSEECRK
jgi:hypothetical protein